MSRAKHGIGARIAECRNAIGWSQDRLGEEVGLSGDAIHSYESERIQVWKPRHIDKLQAIADALGVPLSRLLDAPEPQPALLRSVKLVKVPMYGAISAGRPFTPSADLEWVEVEEWGTSKRRYCRPVKGRSMEPVLYEGDLVEFEEGQPESGWIVDAYDKNGDSTIKAFRVRRGNEILEAVNESYNPVEGDWTCVAYACRVYRDLGFGHQIVIRNKFGGPLSVDRL